MDMSERTAPNRAEAEAMPILWNESRIVWALARWADWLKNTIIPNVYINGCNREIDLALLTKAGVLWAIEVKTSIADWKRDAFKDRYTGHAKPSRFYYAVPETICQVVNGKPTRPYFCDPSAGVIALRNERFISTNNDGTCRVFDDVRLAGCLACRPLHRKPVPESVRLEMMRKLGIRYWNYVAGEDLTGSVEIGREEGTE